MDNFIEERKALNELMEKQDDFFKLFTQPLDTKEWTEAAIPKKYRELMGIAISISAKCNECIAYHIQAGVNSKATIREIVEAIKIGLMAGGSVSYPNARHAFRILNKMGVL